MAQVGFAKSAWPKTQERCSSQSRGRYTDPGLPKSLVEHPSLTWLPKILLFVDARYQRQATGRNSLRLIRRMIEEFAWSKFQPISWQR